MNVNVHIDRLVLEGLPVARAQGPLLRAAVEAELARLLAEHGLAADLLGGTSQCRAEGSPLGVPHEATLGDLGAGIARSVHGGLSGGAPR